MENLSLILFILCVVLFFVICFLLFFLYKTAKTNFILQEQSNVYEDLIIRIYHVLNDDVSFLQGSLAAKLSSDIPEVRDLSNGLSNLRISLSAAKEAVDRLRKEKDGLFR